MPASGRLARGVAIVDDEPALVDIYKNIFRMKGIPVCFTASDGTGAIRQFAECDPKPEIILMDYRMPITDGIEATRKILSISPAKVIFISADEGVKARAFEAGAVMFIQKPASIREILDAVEKVAAM